MPSSCYDYLTSRGDLWVWWDIIAKPTQVLLAVDHHINLHPPSQITHEIRCILQSTARFSRAREDKAIEFLCHVLRGLITQLLVEELLGLQHPHELCTNRDTSLAQISDQPT